MLVLLAIWLIFAVGINWGGAPESLFYLFCGSTDRILHGEVWRLFTAPLMHLPSGTIGHILSALLGLYFLGASLETSWGGKRFLRFMIASALLAYSLQMVAELILPARFRTEVWLGAIPVVEAIAIAWALSFRGQTVRLFFVLPVSSAGLILFVVGMSVMYLIAAVTPPSGMIAPFGGMLAGWLFGGGNPSPMRRLWLKLRLAQLDAEARREAVTRKQRVGRSGLKVIEGGRARSEDDSDAGSQKTKRGPDGRWLN
jgi:membrane associated rhomboid family serine protease